MTTPHTIHSARPDSPRAATMERFRHARTTWRIVLLSGLALLMPAFVHGEEPSKTSDSERARIEYIQKALKGAASPVPNRRVIGAGTGFFVAPQRILTNHHVIERCAALTVRGTNGQNVPAQVLGSEPAHDLALLKTDAVGPDVAVFRSKTAYSAGELVATIGYPDQGLPRIEPFLTRGIVVGPDRNDGHPSRFVIRADVRQGNSGGPVLDQRGTVIGVINAKVDTVRVYQRTGKTVDNVGFAIANGPVFEFLTRHQVTPAVDGGRSITLPQDLLTKSKQFTVRVSCWL